MDFKKICRLCSFKLHKAHDIFGTPGLLDKISKFTDIVIRQGDGLPARICNLCYIKLKISEKFRRQVGKTDKLVRACAMKQTAKSNESQRSFLERATLANSAALKWHGNSSRPKSGRREGIRRERMRLSEGRNTRKAKFLQNVKVRIKDFQRSLIYSYATARSLVASYESLIKRCRTQGFIEEFSIPSSFVRYENESDGRDVDERTKRFLDARQRLRYEKRSMQKYLSNRNSVKNVSASVVGHNFPNFIDPVVLGDPLNLLKVKSIRPVVTEDSFSDEDGFSNDSDTSRNACSRLDYRRAEAPGRRGFVIEDRKDNSSTGCSSPDSDFSGESLRSSSRNSSGSTTGNMNRQRSSRSGDSSPSNPPFLIAAATNGKPCKAEAPLIRQSAQCPICDKICASMHGLKVHFRIHRSEACPICYVATGTKDKFREHMLEFHFKPLVDDSTFKCEICRSIFKTNIGLNAHMRVHSKSVPAIKDCPRCTRTFATVRGFKIHLAKSHSGFETE